MKLISAVLILFLASCGGNTEENPAQEDPELTCADAEEFTIINFSDVDGCTWLLTSEKFDYRLQAINLLDFVAAPSHNQTIKIEFDFKDDLAGICMAGRIVEINCIRD